MSGLDELPELLERYEAWLERQPLSERTRREYARQVAGFVEWLGADGAPDSDALADSFARDYAVRDFKRHLKLERRWSPASVNLALAAVDHFFRFVGLGAAAVTRERLPQAAPRALDNDELARDHVPSSRLQGEGLRDRLQRAVAGLVAAGIVEALETVEVEHGERQRPLVTQRAAALRLQPLVERAVVE